MNKADIIITVVAFALLTIAPSFAGQKSPPTADNIQIVQAGGGAGGAGGGAAGGAGGGAAGGGAGGGAAAGAGGTSGAGAAPGGSDTDATDAAKPGEPPQSSGPARAIDESTGPTSGQTERNRERKEDGTDRSNSPSGTTGSDR